MSTEKICYDGIEEAVLIHALYHGTGPLGMGWLHNNDDLTVEDVRTELGQRDSKYRYHFDYYHGRPLKLTLDTDTKTFDPHLYDRDAGSGTAQQIVDNLSPCERLGS